VSLPLSALQSQYLRLVYFFLSANLAAQIFAQPQPPADPQRRRFLIPDP
jgi:hypothetical protein